MSGSLNSPFGNSLKPQKTMNELLKNQKIQTVSPHSLPLGFAMQPLCNLSACHPWTLSQGIFGGSEGPGLGDRVVDRDRPPMGFRSMSSMCRGGQSSETILEEEGHDWSRIGASPLSALVRHNFPVPGPGEEDPPERRVLF